MFKESVKLTTPRRNFPNRRCCIVCSGICVFSLGVILLLLKAWILQLILRSVLILTQNSLIVDLWLKMPVPIPTNIYFFNWTNPEDFHNFSIKPRLEQVGPYCFVQNMEKVDVVWNDNHTVTYRQVKTWYHNEEPNSGGASLNDTITLLNAVALSSAHNARNYNYFLKKAASIAIAIRVPDIPITKTANEFILGYDDPVMNLHDMFPFYAPDVPHYEKIGLLFIRNKSSDFDGVFNKATGVDGDFDIHNWNYYNVSPYFDSSCARVQGSEGELFSHRELTKDYVDVFVSDLCRYIRLDFESEVVVKGILGYKYIIGDSTLDNGNECFCAGDCIPSGIVNISACHFGLPIYISLPNFYWADPVYLNAVEGLRPEKAKDETYIVLEPQTGLPLKTIARAQFNVLVHPIEGIQTHENLREMYFPIFWAEQIYTIEGYIEFHLNVFLSLPYIIDTVVVILITVAFYLIFFVAYKPMLVSLYKRMYKRKYVSQLSQPEQVPLKT